MTPAGVPPEALNYWSGDAIGLLILLVIMLGSAVYGLAVGIVTLLRWISACRLLDNPDTNGETEE